MAQPTFEFIEALGDYKAIALRLGVSAKTTHGWKTKRIPAKFYPAMCELAREKRLKRPARHLFSFIELPPRSAEAEAELTKPRADAA